jgi:ABC-type sugar transport system ATPase subunit
MNFIEGMIEGGPSGARFRGPGIEQPLPANVSSDLNGCDVALGVRSEHVVIDGAAGIPGTARLLEPLGDVTLVHFDAAQGRSLVAKVAPGSQLAPGAPLSFRFLPEQCHLFDLATGQRRR